MPRIYTKTGDDGTTGLLFGGRVAKSSPAIEVNGAVDEAQAALGAARAETERGSELHDLLVSLEHDLWVLMAEVATAPTSRHKLQPGKSLVIPPMVAALEAGIDGLLGRFDMPSEFVVPGANRVSALLDVARTVVRRAERLAVAHPPDPSSLVGQYLNRLSDLLWAAARWQERGDHLSARRSGAAMAGSGVDAASGGVGEGEQTLATSASGDPVGGIGPARAGGVGEPQAGGDQASSATAGGDSVNAERSTSSMVTAPQDRGPDVSVTRLDDGGSVVGGLASIDVIGVPVVVSDGGPEAAAGVPGRLQIGAEHLEVVVDGEAARRARFTGAVGQTLVTGPGGPGPALMLVGVGKLTETDGEVLRRAAAALVRSAGQSSSVALVAPLGLVVEAGGAGAVGVEPARAARRFGRAVAEGAVLASYRFVAHKSSVRRRGEPAGGQPEPVSAFHLLAVGDVDDEALGAGVRAGRRVASAVWFARDLVNEPPSSLTPTRLAAAVEEELGRSPGTTVEVWDEARIAEENLGGLLGVARGSAEHPGLFAPTYQPVDPVRIDGRVPHLVLVGKGITFDSGGLSLKTPGGMTTMKTDMAGAAAVLAAVSACGDLGVRVKVTAIAPVTENMPGGRAIKPGDVLRARNGKTIEVLNTDAEGRLVLADGLSLAAELEPDAIVDLATLTGACVVALGSQIAGIFGNDDGAVSRVRAASERAGEQLWPMPLPEQYRSHIDSDVADMKNIGKDGQAGAIAAAMLLAEFVGETPWAHLDIAGPARSDEDRGVVAKGATGFGVRTLVALAEEYAPGVGG